jgi:peptidoglycan/xylan/chitin deacetylase (PgdA/CDA1 family)
LKTNIKNSFITENDLINLSKSGNHIGNHGYFHLNNKSTDLEILKNDLLSSKNHLKKIINKNIDSYAIPFGGEKYFSKESLNISLLYHKKIFTSCDYSNYNYNGNPSIYNRRHIEPFWKNSHLNYFLRYKKK